jgi:hypothetical protein
VRALLSDKSHITPQSAVAFADLPHDRFETGIELREDTLKRFRWDP